MIILANISCSSKRPIPAFLGSLTPASEKKCHEASKMAYFFVKFYKFVSAISYYMWYNREMEVVLCTRLSPVLVKIKAFISCNPSVRKTAGLRPAFIVNWAVLTTCWKSTMAIRKSSWLEPNRKLPKIPGYITNSPEKFLFLFPNPPISPRMKNAPLT